MVTAYYADSPDWAVSGSVDADSIHECLFPTFPTNGGVPDVLGALRWCVFHEYPTVAD